MCDVVTPTSSSSSTPASLTTSRVARAAPTRTAERVQAAGRLRQPPNDRKGKRRGWVPLNLMKAASSSSIPSALPMMILRWTTTWTMFLVLWFVAAETGSFAVVFAFAPASSWRRTAPFPAGWATGVGTSRRIHAHSMVVGGAGLWPPSACGRRQDRRRPARGATTTTNLGASSTPPKRGGPGASTLNSTDFGTAAATLEGAPISQASSSPSKLGEKMPWTLNVAQHGPFDQEDWAWAYSTVPPEASCASYPCQIVEGTIPMDLQGTFYRIGPGNFERGGRRYHHVLDGDGFVSSFRLDKGKCTYAGRFVETEMLLEEQAQNQVLYRNVFGTQRDGGFVANAFDVKLKNVANTNLLHWGGRMFALWEAGRPYELDPSTLAVLPPTVDGPLDQLGPADAMRGITVDENGPIDRLLGLGRSFTAHPHVVDDDTLVAVRYGQNPMTKELKMEFVEYDKCWQVKRTVPYGVPDTPAAPHDFSVSSRYYGFVQNRFELDSVPFLLGIKSPTQVLQVPLNEPARLHLVPRRRRRHSQEESTDNAASKAAEEEEEEEEEEEAIVVDVPDYFCIHNLGRMVESDDGNTITLYSNGWNLKDNRYFPDHQRSVPFLGSWGGRCPDFANQVVPPSMLYRTIVDLTTRTLVSHEEVVPGLVIEFPTQEDDLVGLDDVNAVESVSKTDPHSIYCSIASSDYTSMPGSGHCKVDTVHNTVELWWANPKTFTGEMTPVPKRNGDSGSWLLTLLFDATFRRASLAILDSEQFEQGPVATVHLPHSLAYCLHGTFVEDE